MTGEPAKSHTGANLLKPKEPMQAYLSPSHGHGFIQKGGGQLIVRMMHCIVVVILDVGSLGLVLQKRGDSSHRRGFGHSEANETRTKETSPI